MPPGGSSGSPVAPGALIDTHVHFHRCFEPKAFLEAARENFDRAEIDLGLTDNASLPSPAARVLLVMETSGEPLIARLERSREALAAGGLNLESTAETGSLAVGSADWQPLLIVEGRQVVTEENLELLATPCATDLPAGETLDATLAATGRLGAVPILPWGFGKWWGRRGRIISRLLESRPPRGLLLADNGSRLGISWKPRLLTLGAQRGFAIVRGSDPLPIAAESGRAGSSGSFLAGPFDRSRPAATVRTLLGALQSPPRSFGHGVAPATFVANQIRMQLRRRRSP